jgi:hypothetical protein
MTMPAEDEALRAFVKAFVDRRGNTGLPPLSEIMTRFMCNEGRWGRRKVLEASMEGAKQRVDALRANKRADGAPYPVAEWESLLSVIPQDERDSPEYLALAALLAEARELAHMDIALGEHLEKIDALLGDD